MNLSRMLSCFQEHALAFGVSFINPEERAKTTKEIIFPEIIEEFSPLPENLDSFDYLLLSSMFVHTSNINNKQCTVLSDSVFINYKRIISQNNRIDLEKTIRIVHGYYKGIGHQWIEFNQDGKPTPFETNIELPFLFDNPKLVNKSTLKILENIYSLGDLDISLFKRMGVTNYNGKFFLPSFRTKYN